VPIFSTKKEYSLRVYVVVIKNVRQAPKNLLHDLINRVVIDDYS
jgi:hypothetical protein